MTFEFVEFVQNLWGQRRVVEPTQYGIVRVIAKIEHTHSCACESVRDPAVGNREESLGFLDEVRGTTSLLSTLVQTSLHLLWSLLSPCGVGSYP